jgi:sugar (pentulose or hexulose) kinase
VEAAALGNAMVQAVATGHLKDLADGREALKRSVQFESYSPAQIGTWQDAFEGFQSVVGQYRNLEHETCRA